MEMYLGMTSAQANATGLRGTDEGGKLKETGTTHWNSPNTGATNTSGFTGYGGGESYYATIYSASVYQHLLQSGYFWTSSSYNSSGAYYRQLTNGSSKISRTYKRKKDGRSVRCVRD